ncbi:MAG: YfiR family protein [Hydrogenophilales bacterium]|nr:YfiR family protein [Hydrogenophilales bacterium]
MDTTFRPIRHGLSLCLTMLAALVMPPSGQAQGNPLEAKVKAAYLFHLAKFVEWPNLPANELRLCIVGSDSVGEMMGQLANRQLRDRPLKIEVGTLADPTQCQVLYIGQGDKRLPELIRRVRGQGVLTVSDVDDFARQGGIVGFYSEAGKIKLEINPATARGANLKISAKLLELARTVQ